MCVFVCVFYYMCIDGIVNNKLGQSEGCVNWDDVNAHLCVCACVSV